MATLIIHNREDVLEQVRQALIGRGHVCFMARDNAEGQKIMKDNPAVTWRLIVAQKRFPEKTTPIRVYVPEAGLWDDMELFWREVNKITPGLSPT